MAPAKLFAGQPVVILRTSRCLSKLLLVYRTIEKSNDPIAAVSMAAKPEVISPTTGVKQDDIIVAFMGTPRSGKSYFIDLLTGQSSRPAVSYRASVTVEIEATRIPLPNDPGKNIVLVEIPSFANRANPDVEILKMISEWLKAIYERNIKLSGIIYLHSVSDNRMTDSTHQNLRMLKELCGDPAMNRVFFVTTMWEWVDARVGENREKELHDRYWKVFREKGSEVDSLKKANYQEAWRVVQKVVDRRFWSGEAHAVLLQEELVNRGMKLSGTHAGKALYTDTRAKLERQKGMMKTILTQLQNPSNPGLIVELQREYNHLQREYDHQQRSFGETFAEAHVSNLSLRRLFSVLFSRTTRLEAAKVVPPPPPSGGRQSSQETDTRPMRMQKSTVDIAVQNQCRDIILRLCDNLIPHSSITEFKDTEAQCMVNFLSHVLESEAEIEHQKRTSILYLLSRLSKLTQVYPASFELSNVKCDFKYPLGSGGFGAVYKGKLGRREVCVKAVHNQGKGIIRAHVKELVLLGQLSHSRILPFCGTYLSDEQFPRICIVSPWMQNGDLESYLKSFPDKHPIPLISDIICGLNYLHYLEIVHGDLKAKNVLISGTGRALLADFGISHVLVGIEQATRAGPAGTPNWMAPELLENKPPSRESDMWAFGCTCYEVLTRRIPFDGYKTFTALMYSIAVQRCIPERPTPPDHEVGRSMLEDVENKLWDLMKQCWSFEPEGRPKSGDVKEFIDNLKVLDDRLVADPELEALMEEVKKFRQKLTEVEIDYQRVLDILLRVKNASVQVKEERGD